jgi:hypothetical protein
VVRVPDSAMSWWDILRGCQPVKLHGPYCTGEGARWELSAGTRAADDGERAARPYEDGAIIPCPPWRRASAEECELLAASSRPEETGRSVSVLQLCSPGVDLRGCGQRRMGALLQTWCDLDEPLRCIGYTAGPPRLETITVDTRNDSRIGLHVDNWDPSPLDQRDRAINRVTINVGREARYLLYLPICVIDIAALMPGVMVGGQLASADYTGLARAFMRAFPDVPVLRCRLDPNEAYIAPTENLVHDGSSTGLHGLDETYTILGHIRLRTGAVAPA